MTASNNPLAMTPDELKTAVKWMTDKVPEKNQKCELCENDTWEIYPSLFSPPPFKGGYNFSVAYPMFLCGCTKCGNTKFINALHAGVVKNTTNEDEASGK